MLPGGRTRRNCLVGSIGRGRRGGRSDWPQGAGSASNAASSGMLQDRGGLRPGCIVETEVTALGEGARCAGDRGGGGEVREGLPGRRCGATDQRVLIGRQTHGETGVLAPSPFAGCCLAAAVTAWQRGDGSGRTVMRLATGCAMDPPDQIGIQCCLFKVDRQGPCGRSCGRQRQKPTQTLAGRTTS